MTQDSLPLVTIVTPSFNQAPFLRAAIDSVLAQDYPRVEYIVMDGGSADGSLDILRAFDERLSWHSGRDGGQADALAKGFARAQGSILGWLNADDVLFPQALSEAVAYLQAHPEVALVYGDAVYLDAAGHQLMPARQVRPFDLGRLRYWSDYIVQPSAFFRRAAYEAVGGLDIRLRWALDYDLWLKIGARHRLAYVPRLWSGYRVQGDSKTVTGGLARVAEVAAMARRHGLGLPADFRIEKAALHLKEARRALGEGAPIRAAAALGAGIGAIASSWRSLWRFCSWPLWRDILRNRAALRRARSVAPGPPALVRAYDDVAHKRLAWDPLLFGAPIINARLYRKSFMARVGAFDARHSIAADRDWLIRAKLAGMRIATVDATLYEYREHAGSLTINRARANAERIRDQHLAIIAAHIDDHRAAPMMRRWHAWETGRKTAHCLAKSDPAAALRAARQGFGQNPLWPLSFLAQAPSRLAARLAL